MWDRRDDPINSRKGTFSSVSFDQSALFLGSDRQNRKLLMQQFLFVPLGRLVLASRAQAGFAYGRDPLALQRSLPRRRRDQRARLRRGESWSADVDGLPSGGDRLMILNQEARFPIYRWVERRRVHRRRQHFREGRGLERAEGRLRIWACASIRRWACCAATSASRRSDISTSRSNTVGFTSASGTSSSS